MDWQHTYAALWRPRQARLKPVQALDPIGFDDLIGIELQKAAFIENTERFLYARPSNNVLLWGARGTGKSSLIKAALSAYAPQGLRIVEIDRDDLDDLIDIADTLREEPYRFIIFCDDLSFEQGERGYKGLKRILEGSIEMPPPNMRIYATSNRRHLISEYHADNQGTRVGESGEIHYGDSVEEKIALSDRFGLWLSFYNGDQAQYLRLVDHYFKGYGGDTDTLHRDALRFAQSRASKSARTAKQFYNSYTM
ncbi:MAG: ATP-binding protein [Campylobacterales bacterium]|nr:ATP-binding protein [Campylobacterales bacterium]